MACIFMQINLSSGLVLVLEQHQLSKGFHRNLVIQKHLESQKKTNANKRDFI